MNNYLSLLQVFSWYDLIEITFFSLLIYSFIRWLRHDRKSNLLSYFYLGSAGFIIAYMFDLQAIISFYQLGWPMMLILFIILHQKSLQKNYIAARTLTPEKCSKTTNWLTHVMSAAFKSLQHKKDLIFVIEGNDSLDEFINKPITINSWIQQELLDLIVESPLTKPNTIILITQYGKLLAFNCSWHNKIEPLWLEPSRKHHENYEIWEQEALYWTAHLDMLVFHVSSKTKKLTIIAQGTRAPNLIIDKATTIIEQYIRKNSSPNRKKELKKGQELHHE